MHIQDTCDDVEQKPKDHVQEERARIERAEDLVTRDSDVSFPAGDPPSFNPSVTGAGDAKRKRK